MDPLELRKQATTCRLRAAQPGVSEEERQRMLHAAEQLEEWSREIAKDLAPTDPPSR